MRQLMTLFFALVVTLSFPIFLIAQDVASMKGVVTESSGALLPNATVTLLNTGTGQKLIATTDQEGVYRFPSVPPGPGYRATFSAPGFRELLVTDLVLNMRAPRTQNAVLQIGRYSAEICMV